MYDKLKLPLQHPLPQAWRIYRNRLVVLGLIVVLNVGLLLVAVVVRAIPLISAGVAALLVIGFLVTRFRRYLGRDRPLRRRGSYRSASPVATILSRRPTSLLTYLGETTELEGELHLEGLLRIDGIVHGVVDVQGDIEITAMGLVEGPEVRAHNLIVHGVLKSPVYVTGKLILSRTAQLEGDVVAGAVEIEPGAYYSGYIEIRDQEGWSAAPGDNLSSAQNLSEQGLESYE
jgi:cytoskeletal protein CcmA (bactofilin family)